MVVHIVVLRLKAEAAPAQVGELLTALRNLPAQVPGILDLDCGRNFSPGRAQGYDLGLVVRFPGQAELAAYGPHPAHQAVRRRIDALCSEVLVLDFEA